MKLKVLGSGSKGNCYLLVDKHEVLIIECGLNYKDILKALDFNIRNVVGCLVSHEHMDHSKSINEVMKAGINVYLSHGTMQHLEISNKVESIRHMHRAIEVQSEKQFKTGNFTILPFSTEHDAKEPLGFLIQHKDMGKLLFVTDSYYCKYKFKDLNHILIECNYSSEILSENMEQGLVPWSLRNRLLKSHFSLDNLKGFLRVCDLQQITEITLIHLSENNSNANLFKNEIERSTGKIVHIAEKGLEIDLNIWL